MYVTLGKIWDPISYKILNKNNNNKGKSGELVLKGDSVAHGYVGNTKLTKKSF